MSTVTMRLPRRSALDRRTAMRLARTEYGRFADALNSVGPAEWTLPTDCPGWDVRAMASHVLGMASLAASVREGGRQRKLALHGDGEFIDELTALQVRERQQMSGADIAAQFAEEGRRAARGRRRTPWFIRRRPMPVAQDVGGTPETWTIGFVNDVILTRDTWMHRVDLARATQRPFVSTADHDGVLVADVVAEWAGRHSADYDLTLTGAAGGTWSRGAGGEVITMDAVDFCRSLSGRAPQPGLLCVPVPF